MFRSRFVVILAVVAAVMSTVTGQALASHGGGGSSGGGGGEQGDAANGKKLFAQQGCGGCHTLKAAGSSGNVGPNLDQLKPPFDTVKHQVEVGGGAMPAFKGQLSDAQIQAVSEYVASAAGK
jgi:mono/diheme cytochrome c family protein